MEYNQLLSNRRFIEQSSDHSSAQHFDDGSRDGSSRGRQSYTPCCPSSSSTPSCFIPEHQNEFLTKIINFVKTNPSRVFTPDCICCYTLNQQEVLRKHKFTECPIATDNEFCNKTFISVCHLLNSWRKKSRASTIESTTTSDLALNRLKAILGSSEDQLEDADIESDDEISVTSYPDFPSGNESVHDSLSQR